MRRLLDFCLLAFTLVLAMFGASGVRAFGPEYIYENVKPLGREAFATCNFEVFNLGSVRAWIWFQLADEDVEGSFFYDSGIQYTGKPITADSLKTNCGFTSVNIISQNGATGSYGTDDYMGVIFDAIAPGDPVNYRYELALSGAASTSFINTRVVSEHPATADAGVDQSVASAAGVTLDGSASSANDAGQNLTHAWSQTAGPAVVLDDAGAASPGFTAPVLVAGAPVQVLTFSLVVNDGVADSAADMVQITVNPPPNTVPTANAGADQTVASGAGVTLDGTATSEDHTSENQSPLTIK